MSEIQPAADAADYLPTPDEIATAAAAIRAAHADADRITSPQVKYRSRAARVDYDQIIREATEAQQNRLSAYRQQIANRS